MSVEKGGKAPVYDIPDRRIVAVQHPCIVQNVERAIKSLGGDQALNPFLARSKSRPLAVSLRPEDPFAQTIAAQYVKTGNVLLKVRVPKRTGRKRKRGTDDPYQHDPVFGPVEGPDVHQSLVDKSDLAVVTPVGIVHETWRFRGMPSFQFAAQGRTFDAMRDTLLSTDLTKIKSFTLDTSMQLEPGEEIQPPPYLQPPLTAYAYA
jgi:general transcription factor 3C polypeptide 5 (transcription factor C subunit 1)